MNLLKSSFIALLRNTGTFEDLESMLLVLLDSFFSSSSSSSVSSDTYFNLGISVFPGDDAARSSLGCCCPFFSSRPVIGGSCEEEQEEEAVENLFGTATIGSVKSSLDLFLEISSKLGLF